MNRYRFNRRFVARRLNLIAKSILAAAVNNSYMLQINGPIYFNCVEDEDPEADNQLSKSLKKMSTSSKATTDSVIKKLTNYLKKIGFAHTQGQARWSNLQSANVESFTDVAGVSVKIVHSPMFDGKGSGGDGGDVILAIQVEDKTFNIIPFKNIGASTNQYQRLSGDAISEITNNYSKKISGLYQEIITITTDYFQEVYEQRQATSNYTYNNSPENFEDFYV